MRWILSVSILLPVQAFYKSPSIRSIQPIYSNNQTPYLRPLPIPPIKKSESLELPEPPSPPEPSENKFHHFLKLIRFNTILPTTLLHFMGGLIINPNLISVLKTPSFIVSGLITLLVLSSSMIINDLYDINTDKINSPDRPLVSGKITIPQAIITANLFIFGAEFLNMRFLPESIQYIAHEAIALILLYTPVLKRIPFIKNIACASLVSFSVFFSALSITNTKSEMIVLNNHYGLLMIAISTIFFGSLSNEILLDVKDYDGDKKNNVYTLPVIFSKKIAWIFSLLITSYNIFANTMSISYIYNNMELGILYFVLMSPLLIESLKIRQEQYSKDSINAYMKKTNKPLFLFFIYLFILGNIPIG